jgi:hypothetical protein
MGRSSGSPFRREAHAGVRCIVCEKIVHDDETAWWTPARAGVVCSLACCGVIEAVGRKFFPRAPRVRVRPTERKDSVSQRHGGGPPT